MKCEFMLVIVFLDLYIYVQSLGINKTYEEIINNYSNHISINIYKILAKRKDNILFCPVGLNTILAFLTLGSKGLTALEMKQSLHLFKNIHPKIAFKMLLTKLSDGNMRIATGIFAQKGLTIDPNFIDIAWRYFNTDVRRVDFKSSTKDAIDSINSLIQKKTRNYIQDIFDERLARRTVLLLVNAAHFTDYWSDGLRYELQGPILEDFYLTKDKIVKSKMMSKPFTHTKDWYTMDAILNAKILKLYFQNPLYSMVIILPNEVDGLSKVEHKLTPNLFQEILNRLKLTPLLITIPMFKIEKRMKMNNILKKLGMKKLFTPKAELSGIIKNMSHIQRGGLKIIQKTYINLNRSGVETTEESGMSDVVFSGGLTVVAHDVFKANRPFLFTIMHGDTIILQGRLKKP